MSGLVKNKHGLTHNRTRICWRLTVTWYLSVQSHVYVFTFILVCFFVFFHIYKLWDGANESSQFVKRCRPLLHWASYVQSHAAPQSVHRVHHWKIVVSDEVYVYEEVSDSSRGHIQLLCLESLLLSSSPHTSMTTVSLRCLGSLARCGFSVRVCQTSTWEGREEEDGVKYCADGEKKCRVLKK